MNCIKLNSLGFINHLFVRTAKLPSFFLAKHSETARVMSGKFLTRQKDLQAEV